MTPCDRWKDSLLAYAAGQTPTPELAAHLSGCASCRGALDAWRARVSEVDRVLIRLMSSEPRPGAPERVLARIATREPAAAPLYRRLTAAAALVILACLIARTGRPVRTVSLSKWRSPTEWLLRSQADPMLKSVPRLGDGFFEVDARKENHAQ